MTVDLRLGNCLDIMRTLPDGCVDAVVTDPPYGTKVTEWDHSIDEEIFAQCCRISRGYCVFFYANTRLYHILSCLNDLGMDTWTAVWHKTNSMQIARKFLPHWSPIVIAYKGKVPFWGKDVEACPIVPQHNGHPTAKMPGIMRWCVTKACAEGQTILDPFMGSGTTGVACVQTGRNFIGIEIDPGYFEIAQRRIAAAQEQMSLLTEPTHDALCLPQVT